MRLYDLAFASYIYARMTTYDEAYRHFRHATAPALDLANSTHCIELLDWLRTWGCRHFARVDDGLASTEIQTWYERSQDRLPAPNKPLQALSECELSTACEAYADLYQRTASRRRQGEAEVDVAVGPTCASRVLFCLRPEALVPWDGAVRRQTRLDGSPASYRRYLCRMCAAFDELTADCARNDCALADLPALLGRPGLTLVKLAEEYHWVTITRNCPPINSQILVQWALWDQRGKRA